MSAAPNVSSTAANEGLGLALLPPWFVFRLSGKGNFWGTSLVKKSVNVLASVLLLLFTGMQGNVVVVGVVGAELDEVPADFLVPSCSDDRAESFGI